ncbi:beta-L-arabinofuranosidase domain-containing protein [Botrimarina mediterranea]|uniref:Non-reducing end beta-L-arabinofuranosidase n=2 Tax=Botrimarina mediterranea TaxID=2528022 RepID=A0A518K7P8_9BACT|nr:beta-L-arabinofuranosidase domain-containing protein [Botrimarina mediterranea]QDV73828.1 Non-reducing end beta-L-arabinofuranosidase [Botrimarina mediterranea]QDV78457.1 Non-reducing end beta-L-arabinofuranosidase [Planctomycetes bacterium K2D]
MFMTDKSCSRIARQENTPAGSRLVAARWLIAGALVIAEASAFSPAHAETKPVFTPAETARLELSGPVDEFVQAVVENWLLRVPRDNPAILTMFADRDQRPYRNLLPWSGEFAGKYLTCLSQVLRLSDDTRLEELGGDFVEQLVSLQAENGYLGPFPESCQLTGVNAEGGRTWDAWGHYHVMVGLLLWYDRTGDEKALACASRIGDLFCEKFQSADEKISSIGSAEMNQAVVHSLAMLFTRTGEPRYRDLANEIVLDFSAPNAGNYLEAGLEGLEFYQIPKPRWESLHSLMGMAELYWNGGNKDYRDVFEHFWWSIVKLDRHNNGGFSSGERAHGDPYHPGPIETCCTVAWMAMSVEMLKMSGDSRVADELELSTLNQALATHAPSGEWSTYNTPMDGRRIPSTIDIAFQVRPGSEGLNCCSVNAARMFGMISDWALMRDRGGLVLNWYGPSKFAEEVNGQTVTITQDTTYPRDGSVKVRIDLQEPSRFGLKLRIPHWSAKTQVSVNGERMAVEPGAYLEIDREWNSGDVIDVGLDMSLRCWTGQKAYDGKASIYRGPLLMAYEETNSAAVDFSETWQAYGHFRAAAEKGASVSIAFQGETLEWRGFYMDDAGKAKVTVDGKEVAVVDQYGPKRDRPFEWKLDGLGPGKHVARIEVLAEQATDSKGCWINVQDLKSTADIPPLDASTLSKCVVKPSRPGFLLLEVGGGETATVQLRDYATVGQGGASYFSWLPAVGLPETPFSSDNPSRTSTISP